MAHEGLWQSTLNAPEGAELHLAVFMGEALAWETFVPIPAEPGLVKTVVSRYFWKIFANFLSRSSTVRLNTRRSAFESGSTAK